MIISLIGMSGTGKSHWSDRLKNEAGFEVFDCDFEIEKLLEPELKNLGFSGINDMSKWMGQPFEERYSKNSQKYLELEEKVTAGILNEVEKNIWENKNLVIDTTGSVIYLKSETLEKLEKLTKIFYLTTPKEKVEKMINLYFEDPKPVFWGDSFVKEEGLSLEENLKKYYPKLLKFRQEKYSKLADKELDYEFLRSGGASVEKFLK